MKLLKAKQLESKTQNSNNNNNIDDAENKKEWHKLTESYEWKDWKSMVKGIGMCVLGGVANSGRKTQFRNFYINMNQ